MRPRLRAGDVAPRRPGRAAVTLTPACRSPGVDQDGERAPASSGGHSVLAVAAHQASTVLPVHLLLDRAARGPATDLPFRHELEARYGRSLVDVDVFHDAEAQATLAALGAVAATRGNQVFFSEERPALSTVVHEVTHVLQALPVGPAADEAVVPEATPAEAEATAEAERAERADAPVRPAATLAPGAIALLRSPVMEEAPAPIELDPASPRLQARDTATSTSGPAVVVAPATDAAGGAARGAGVAGPGPAPLGAGEPATPDEGYRLPEPPPVTVTAEDIAAREAAVAEAQAVLAGAGTAADSLSAFAAAPPTLKATAQATMGDNVNAALAKETAQITEETPTLTASMSGTTGAAPPDVNVAAPAPRDIDLEPIAPPPAPEPSIPETPRLESYTANDGVDTSVALRFRTDDPELKQQAIGSSLNDVQTSDPEAPRSAGPPPPITLGGETSPDRMAQETDRGVGEAQAARQEALQGVLDGPGPDAVQPVAGQETREVGRLAPPSVAATTQEEGAAKLASMQLQPEVLVAFDQNNQASMEASMQGAVDKATTATTDRDTQRQEEVAKAEAVTQDLSRQADKDQDRAVTAGRTKIQLERQATIDAQHAAVAEVRKEADGARAAEQAKIDTEIAEKQGQIDARYAQADTDIKAKNEQAEADARKAKADAARDAQNRSWWDRAVDFVKDAFNALISVVSAIFDKIRAAINTILDGIASFAKGLIDAVATFVKASIKAFGTILKAAVTGLIGTVFPELAEKLNTAIDTAVNTAVAAVDAVAETLKAGIDVAVETLRKAINAVIDVFQAGIVLALELYKAALTGDWSDVLKRVLEAALRVVGVEPETFYAFIGRARETFQIIVDSPGAFVGNLIDAFVGGVQRFSDHFLVHLQAGIVGWLTGALGDIQVPARWDVWAVLDIARQVLGLTWDFVKRKASEVIGQNNVERLAHVFDYIEVMVKEGWKALWDRIVSDLSNLKDLVLNAIKDFLVTRVIVAAITKLASLFNPVGALVQLVLTAWNLYTFLRDNLRRIGDVVVTIVNAIGDIARRILEPAMKAVEDVLARLLVVAIDLLAKLLNLGGITAKVREIIQDVRQWIDQAVTKLIQRVLGLFQGGGAATTPEATSPSATAGAPVRPIAIGFDLPEGHHSITASLAGGRYVLSIGSEAQGRVTKVLADVIDELRKKSARSARAEAANAPLIASLELAKEEAGDQAIAQQYIADGAPVQRTPDEIRYGLVPAQYVAMRINVIIEQLKVAFARSGLKGLDSIINPVEFLGSRFLPHALRGSEWIRPNLYGTGRWQSFRDRIVRAKVTTIADTVTRANATNDIDVIRATLRALKENHEIPEEAVPGSFTAADVRATRYELDHIETVREHWNKAGGGKASNDVQREQYYYDEDNLRTVTAKYNQEREKGRYDDYVTPDFVTYLAQAGTRGAKTITYNGTEYFFLDQPDGKPIP